MLSDQTQAILLLTAHFGKPVPGAAKPLTPTEWGRFAEWLHHRALAPEQLLTGRREALLAEHRDKTITTERIAELLGRGAAMVVALEKWLRAGLWVLTRSDADYPIQLKQRLRGQAPALLFGCGNKSLLSGGGLAVARSRTVGETDLAYSRGVGVRAAPADIDVLDVRSMCGRASTGTAAKADSASGDALKGTARSTRPAVVSDAPRCGPEPVLPCAEPENKPSGAHLAKGANESLAEISFFQLFLAKVESLCAVEPRTHDQLAETLDVDKAQLSLWLKQAVSEKRLKKLANPVRYGAPNERQRRLPFD